MATNLSNYFEEYNPSVIKDYCTRLLNEGNVDFAAIMDLARRLTLMDAELKSSNYKQRNWMAEGMFGNYVGLLYDNYPERISIDDEKRPYVKLADDVRVYPKKLDNKYLPSNISTRHVRKLNAQELFDGGSKVHVLYAGFILTDNIWPNEFKGSYISFINEYYPTKVEWVLDCADFRKKRCY